MKLLAHLPRLLALVAVAVFATGIQAQPAPQKLGTLFFTPAERTNIALIRSGQDGAKFASSTPLSVTGMVKRGRAKSTVWINGLAVTEGQSINSGPVPQIGARNVAIDGQAVRVGETLVPESGTRVDFVPSGTVSVRIQR